MSARRPTFRVMKNGYDRFAVDDAIEKYAVQVEQLEEKLRVYEMQLQNTEEQLSHLQEQYQSLENSLSAEKRAAENIARLSLREANEIIDTAQKNADQIIRQSLITARDILLELSKLYGDADNVKASTRANLAGLLQEIDNFQLPRMPDVSWLKEAGKKIR